MTEIEASSSTSANQPLLAQWIPNKNLAPEKHYFPLFNDQSIHHDRGLHNWNSVAINQVTGGAQWNKDLDKCRTGIQDNDWYTKET